MIPGQPNTLWLEASEPGVYRGQCAEFCGLQHANMIIRVVADPPAEFDRWVNIQAQPGADAALTLDGRRLFEGATCAGCHRVRGTSAVGNAGPDLTHFGGRATLGAGVRPLSDENLRHWITDPQSIKPGAAMPPTTLSADQLDALVAFLRGLH
jgi:cytochrome c oxidase subunit 2